MLNPYSSMYVVGPAVRQTRPTFASILPNLMVGEYPNPHDVSWLVSQSGITAVLSLQDDADLLSKNLELDRLIAVCRAENVRFDRVPLPDGDTLTLARLLDDVVNLLNDLLRDGHRVYLHCNAGMNRAPTVAVAYLHACEGLSLTAARDFVKAQRPCVPYMRVLSDRYGRE